MSHLSQRLKRRLFLKVNAHVVDAGMQVIGMAGLIHTIRRFDECADIGGIIIALPDSEIAAFAAQLLTYQFNTPIRLVTGGAERRLLFMLGW